MFTEGSSEHPVSGHTQKDPSQLRGPASGEVWKRRKFPKGPKELSTGVGGGSLVTANRESGGPSGGRESGRTTSGGRETGRTTRGGRETGRPTSEGRETGRTTSGERLRKDGEEGENSWDH